jgi:hypothetical protein
MGDDEVGLVHFLTAEEKNVNVDDARTPAFRRDAPPLEFDRFRRPQQLPRRAIPFALNDLVEESRLIGDAPWLGLDDSALAQDANTFFPQPAPRGAQVA